MEIDHARFFGRLQSLQGEMSDAAFSRKVGVPATTLKQYEKGSFPSIAIAARIADACGVTVDWLSGRDLTRRGPDVLAVNADLMEKLARLVSSVYREVGQKLPGERATLEAAALYNDLSTRVGDISDADEVEAVLPQLKYQLKKRLSEAAAEPGTGKRTA